MSVLHLLPVPCPCCSHPTPVPTPAMLRNHFKLSPHGFAILEKLWSAKGEPVSSQRLFDAMYADCKDGGPCEQTMYRNLKAALHYLRCKLDGTGLAVVSCGYRAGWRIIITQPFPTAEEA